MNLSRDYWVCCTVVLLSCWVYWWTWFWEVPSSNLRHNCVLPDWGFCCFSRCLQLNAGYSHDWVMTVSFHILSNLYQSSKLQHYLAWVTVVVIGQKPWKRKQYSVQSVGTDIISPYSFLLLMSQLKRCCSLLLLTYMCQLFPVFLHFEIQKQSMPTWHLKSNTVEVQKLTVTQVYTENFTLGVWGSGVGNPEAMYNICLILKICVIKIMS